MPVNLNHHLCNNARHVGINTHHADDNACHDIVDYLSHHLHDLRFYSHT